MGSDVEVPILDDAIDEFDRMVSAEPAVMDDTDRELRLALGLRGGRG